GSRATVGIYVHIIAHLIAFVDWKDHHGILVIPAAIILVGPFRVSLNQHLVNFTHVALQALQAMFALLVDNLGEPSFFDLFRNIVGVAFGCQGAGAFRIGKHVSKVVFYVVHHGKRVLMLFFGLTAKARDDVCRNPAVRNNPADGIYPLHVPFTVVRTVHQRQYTRVAGLYGQVNILAYVFIPCHGIKYLVGDVFWVRRGKPHT